jgi:hypothetical protein
LKNLKEDNIKICPYIEESEGKIILKSALTLKNLKGR